MLGLNSQWMPLPVASQRAHPNIPLGLGALLVFRSFLWGERVRPTADGFPLPRR